MEKTVFYEGIGNVYFKKKINKKRISISVNNEYKISITMPYTASYEEAEKFLLVNKQWINDKLQLYKERQSKIEIFYPGIKYKTKFGELILKPENRNDILLKIEKNITTISFPEYMEHEKPFVQNAVRKAFAETWRLEAKKYIPQRVEFLAKKFNFQYNNISIKNAITRWGSCSSVNNLNFTLHLMRLPDDVIDYVIIHELCHTKIKNHSPAFWKCVENIDPEYKQKEAILKGFCINKN